MAASHLLDWWAERRARELLLLLTVVACLNDAHGPSTELATSLVNIDNAWREQSLIGGQALHLRHVLMFFCAW